MRVCPETDCPELVDKGRCPAHQREREQRRGTRQQRGYDVAYDKRRIREARIVASGRATCWSCGLRISPLEAWDLGHCDDDRSIIHGAQHRAENRDTAHAGPCVHISHVTYPPGG